MLCTLSPQERENITANAQHALRLIAFNQIHVILAIERQMPDVDGGEAESNGGVAVAADRKRPRESNGTPGADGWFLFCVKASSFPSGYDSWMDRRGELFSAFPWVVFVFSQRNKLFGVGLK